MSELEPQDKRARLERSYAKSYGLEPSDPRIAALVLADLEMVDAAERAGDLRPASPPVYDDAERPKPAELADAERELGVRLLDENTRGEPALTFELDANPLLTSEKWSKAAARVGRILEGMAGGGGDFRVACRSAAIPGLALEYTELYWYFLTRTRPAIIGHDHNPFRGLTESAAARMLVAKVFDICDKSTGRLGWWYVK